MTSVQSCSSPVKSASKELQSMIQQGSDDAERFGELVDILLESELPFKEAALGSGEWQVSCKSCSLPAPVPQHEMYR